MYIQKEMENGKYYFFVISVNILLSIANLFNYNNKQQ